MGYLVVKYVKTADQARALQRDASNVVAVYKLPARDTATCPGMSCKGRPDGYEGWTSGWGNDPETGMLVHACGRPHKDWRKRLPLTLFQVLGLNRLKRDKTPRLLQNPTNWGK